MIGTGQENLLKRLWLGAGIGLILWILAVIIAGYGHGIFAFALLSSAPLPPFTSPLLWALLAYLTRWRIRWVFPVTEALHFLGAAIYVWYRWAEDLGDPYRNQHALAHFKPYIIVFAFVYLGGQIWLWRTYLTDQKPTGLTESLPSYPLKPPTSK
jgi:hypothetical protein